MSGFNESLVRETAEELVISDDEKSLIESFVIICQFLAEHPSAISWRTSKANPHKPTVVNQNDLFQLAKKYFEGYRRSDFPVEPSTIPDPMVSIIMREAYGYSNQECQRIKIEHQYAMCAENCVGNLLERYIDSVLRGNGWNWCCGEFIKAIDFLGKNNDGEWIALQIKNRDNSENSSSSAIRDGTKIQKWFRSFSKDTKKGRSSFTNWKNLPPLMQGYNLNEEGFKEFVIQYINIHKPKNS
ncbi:SinI family restriction endonuclease [Pleurocapsa sp. FMAR1]|uniref:SinI family restriction endonuclease n=1 Tax=Pleurocapsa sp. FMAR1 TaxID=3040204 RepID=UPI0029C7E20B|nr:SinI family restriction endonuclease [Pleurocapsa sp. FMAR1]